MKTGLIIIQEERRRQKQDEGFSVENDQIYVDEGLALAALCYVMPEKLRVAIHAYPTNVPKYWPWHKKWWKPTFNREAKKAKKEDRIRELAKAGALIAAEIDRINRMSEKEYVSFVENYQIKFH